MNHSTLGFGQPSRKCLYCGALLWYEERVWKAMHHRNPHIQEDNVLFELNVTSVSILSGI